MLKKVGSTTLAKISSQKEMADFVKTLDLKSNKIIIKPNWVQPRIGAYTDAKVLDWFLTVLAKPAIIIESYSFWRTDKYAVSGTDYFSSKEATIISGKKHWEHFKKQDEWFLKATGIDEVLQKHKAEYLNITNEVWAGKIADPKTIKKIVEEKSSPVHFPELYSYVPEKLFELRGSDLVSFAKAKREIEFSFTLSTKNLFGLIPDPCRYPKYHAEDESLISSSICDANKIYRSLFSCTFLAEGIFTASDCKKSMKQIGLVEDWGVIWAGKNSVEVDTLGVKLLQAQSPTTGIDILKETKKVFGGFDESILVQVPKTLIINY